MSHPLQRDDVSSAVRDPRSINTILGLSRQPLPTFDRATYASADMAREERHDNALQTIRIQPGRDIDAELATLNDAVHQALT